MKYDFDKVVDRSGSGDLKHEVLAERYGRGDLLPLWVADMDFETPQFITDALRKRLEHSLFGYTIFRATTGRRWLNGLRTITSGVSTSSGCASYRAS